MANFVLTGRFVTSDNIAIPSTSIPEANLLYIDLFNPNSAEYAKLKINVGSDGTFILPLTTSILGFATTIEEVVNIVNKLKIYIPEERGKIAEYNRPVQSKGTSTVLDEVINGSSKFGTRGQIIVINLGDIVLQYFTPPVSSPPPPPTPTITFSDIPIASDASLLFNPSTASFFILKGVVKDNESKLPIPDVSVHLTSVNYFSQGTTDNNGVFYIPTEKSTLTELDILSTSIYEQLEFTIPTDKQLTFSGYQEIILDSTLTPSPTSFPVFEYSDFFLKKKNIEEEVIDGEELATEEDKQKIQAQIDELRTQIDAAKTLLPLPANVDISTPTEINPTPPPTNSPTVNPVTGANSTTNSKNKIRNTLVGIVVDENG